MISPDASIGWCDPIELQKANAKFNKDCFKLFLENGFQCIQNVRFGDARSYDFCFNGIPPNALLAIGSHGALRRADYRLVFEAGLDELCTRKKPKKLLIYGYAPKKIFQRFINLGIMICRFPSEFELSHGEKHGA